MTGQQLVPVTDQEALSEYRTELARLRNAAPSAPHHQDDQGQPAMTYLRAVEDIAAAALAEVGYTVTVGELPDGTPVLWHRPGEEPPCDITYQAYAIGWASIGETCDDFQTWHARQDLRHYCTCEENR